MNECEAFSTQHGHVSVEYIFARVKQAKQNQIYVVEVSLAIYHCTKTQIASNLMKKKKEQGIINLVENHPKCESIHTPNPSQNTKHTHRERRKSIFVSIYSPLTKIPCRPKQTIPEHFH